MSRVDIVRDFPLPNLGPLIALAFDKTVTIAVGSWKVLLVVMLLSTVSGYFGANFALIPSWAFVIYWFFECYANAVRLERPEYRMSAARVLTLFGLSIGIVLLIVIGLLLLVAPGVYFGTKYSMAAIVAVANDVGVNEARTRSWSLTEKAFWHTLGFNVVLYFAMLALSTVGYIIAVAAISGLGQLLVQLLVTSVIHVMSVDDFMRMYGAIVGLGICVYLMAVSFGYQAHAIAQLYWLRALELRANAAGAAVADPT